MPAKIASKQLAAISAPGFNANANANRDSPELDWSETKTATGL